jgi:hypothetical protein
MSFFLLNLYKYCTFTHLYLVLYPPLPQSGFIISPAIDPAA